MEAFKDTAVDLGRTAAGPVSKGSPLTWRRQPCRPRAKDGVQLGSHEGMTMLFYKHISWGTESPLLHYCSGYPQEVGGTPGLVS